MDSIPLSISESPLAPIPMRSRPLADQELANGFLLTNAEIIAAHGHHRIYPVRLASTMDAEAALLHAAWATSLKKPFIPSDFPWVPIGLVGPMLVLGHVHPAMHPPPMPWGTFQPVLLRREDYERQLRNVALVIDGRTNQEDTWNGEFGGGSGRFPSSLIFPTERRSALHFVQQYFLHRPDDARILSDAAILVDVPEESLPGGYAAALRFILEDSNVVQTLNLRLPESPQKRLPEPLRRRLSVVYEVDQHLWIAAPFLPQSEAEDRLYAELGEGWVVHWLLRAGEERTTRALPSPPPTSHQTHNGKIVVVGSASRPPIGVDQVKEEKEREIVLEEKIWRYYEPRKREAQPEDLWRAALFRAIDNGSTDLHFEPGVEKGRVRFRVDGHLEEMMELPTAICESMVYSIMIQTGMGSEKYRPKDGSFTVRIISKSGRAQEVRVRSSAFPVLGTAQKLALRLLAKQEEVPTLQALLPPVAHRLVSRAISRADGLILVTGPTGSGKTTTIFSCIVNLNRPENNITTLEDPVEYVIPGVNQGEVNALRDIKWEDLNTAFLRQDPDIGLVGEIRDAETLKALIRLANTGHLVFGSLHTKSCPTSVLRLLDLGASPLMISEALVLVVSQRLIRRVCPKCSSEAAPCDKVTELYRFHELEVPKTVRRASEEGCTHCRNRGYKGRMAAAEVLPIVPEIKAMIQRSAQSSDYAAWMRGKDLRTVFENALELAAAGHTTVEEALRLQDAWDGDDWTNFKK